MSRAGLLVVTLAASALLAATALAHSWPGRPVGKPPGLKQSGPPRTGELLRMHLGFRPREVHLTIYRGLRFTHYRLPRHQILTWRARGSGVIALDAEAPDGSASYLIRLKTH